MYGKWTLLLLSSPSPLVKFHVEHSFIVYMERDMRQELGTLLGQLEKGAQGCSESLTLAERKRERMPYLFVAARR